MINNPYLDPLPFDLTRLMVRHVLKNALALKWTVQGFGMMRTYFGEDDRYRLNVWTRKLAVPNVSLIHDHPWCLTSWIIAGELTNVRYHKDKLGVPPNFQYQKIRTGEGGRPIGEVWARRLTAQQPERYSAGDVYSQHAKEIHATHYAEGTVTMNERTHRDGEDALVFWPIGEKWVDAEPRKATHYEIVTVADHALRTWFPVPGDDGESPLHEALSVVRGEAAPPIQRING